MRIAGHLVTPAEVGLVSLGVGGAILLYARRGRSSSGPWGWQGPVEEVPTVRQPGFPNTTAGHIGFTKWVIPLLQSHGLSHEAAVLFAAHIARETGYGSSVWDYNFGNIKLGTNKPRGPWFWLTDARGFRDKYRAYLTADDGIEDNINLVRNSSLYKKAWAMLMAGDPNWYGQLGLSGYYEGPPDPNRPGVHTHHTPQTIIPVQNEYNGVVRLIRQYEASTSTPAPPTNLAPSELASRYTPPPSAAPNRTITPLQIIAGAIALGGGAYWAYSELQDAIR